MSDMFRVFWKCHCCGGEWSARASRILYDAISWCDRCTYGKCGGSYKNPCRSGRPKKAKRAMTNTTRPQGGEQR